MFTRSSRYSKFEDVINVDATGRKVLSKPLRLTPQLAAEAFHTVDEFDRIDLIAHKYYRKSKKWWRICDANVDHFSPRQLLGNEAVVITRFPLLGTEMVKQFPWAQLINILSNEPGVQGIERYEQSRLHETQQNVDSMLVSLWSEQIERAVDITYNGENLSTDDIVTILTDNGFPVAAPLALRRIGSEIAIPSNSSV